MYKIVVRQLNDRNYHEEVTGYTNSAGEAKVIMEYALMIFPRATVSISTEATATAEENLKEEE